MIMFPNLKFNWAGHTEKDISGKGHAIVIPNEFCSTDQERLCKVQE